MSELFIGFLIKKEDVYRVVEWVFCYWAMIGFMLFRTQDARYRFGLFA